MEPDYYTSAPNDPAFFHGSPTVVIFISDSKLFSAVCGNSAKAAIPNPTSKEFYLNFGRNSVRALVISVAAGMIVGGIEGSPAGVPGVLGGILVGGINGARLAPTAAIIDSGLQPALTNGASVLDLLNSDQNSKLAAELQLISSVCGTATAASLGAAGLKLSKLTLPSVSPELVSIARKQLGMGEGAQLISISHGLVGPLLSEIVKSNSHLGSALPLLTSLTTEKKSLSPNSTASILVDFNPSDGIESLLRAANQIHATGKIVELRDRIYLLTEYDPESANQLMETGKADAIFMVGKPKKRLVNVRQNITKTTSWPSHATIFENSRLFTRLKELLPSAASLAEQMRLFRYSGDIVAQGSDLDPLVTQYSPLLDTYFPGRRLLRSYPPSSFDGELHRDNVTVWVYPIFGPGPTVSISNTGGSSFRPDKLIGPGGFVTIMRGNLPHSSTASEDPRVIYVGNETFVPR